MLERSATAPSNACLAEESSPTCTRLSALLTRRSTSSPPLRRCQCACQNLSSSTEELPKNSDDMTERGCQNGIDVSICQVPGKTCKLTRFLPLPVHLVCLSNSNTQQHSVIDTTTTLVSASSLQRTVSCVSPSSVASATLVALVHVVITTIMSFFARGQFFKSLMMNAQAVSRCLFIPPWCLYQSVHFLRFQLLGQLLVLLRDRFLHDHVCLTRNQLSHISTPIRHCSVDTE